MESNRIEWIDCAKAILAMLVILLHIPNFDISKSIINSFVIPVFYILTGFTFKIKQDKFKDYVWIKIKTILWPSFIIYGIINTILKFLYAHIFDVEYKINLKKRIIGMLIEMRGSYDFGAWFLVCLFTSLIIIYFLKKYIIKSTNQILIWSIGFYLCGSIYALLIHKVLPWSLDVAIFAVSYILFGYYLKESKVIERITDFRIFLLGIIAFCVGNVLAISTNNIISMYLNNIGNPFFSFLSIIGGLLIVAFMSRRIEKIKFIKFIGQNSLIIYCSQYLYLFILDNIALPNILVLKIFICFISVLTGTVIESYLIRKYAPILIGKYKKSKRI